MPTSINNYLNLETREVSKQPRAERQPPKSATRWQYTTRF